MRRPTDLVVPLVAALLLPLPALAYVGPGAGLTVIGTILGVIGAVFLLIVGFLWYPIKRLIKGRPAARPGPGETGQGRSGP